MKTNMRRLVVLIGFLSTVLSISTLMAQDRGAIATGSPRGGRPDAEGVRRGGGNPFADGKRPDGVKGVEGRKEFGGRGAGGRGAGDANGARAVAVKMREKLSDAERGDLESLRRKMLADGIEYLRKVQLPNGSFSSSPRVGVGPTMVVAIGLLRAEVKLDDPLLAKTLAYLEGAIRDDGGIYSESGMLSNYESCIGLICFKLANDAAGDGRYDDVLVRAEKFIRGAQYNEANGTARDDQYFGGLGYNEERSTRPDLSNTQFFIEALREVGADEDDQAIQDALVFVSRCQNLESEDNPSGEARGEDGGFFYTFVSPDENPAGQEVSGGLRSYGSMTYAGLKSLIYAGLTADDPRVEAASKWIGEHYTTTENPGLGKRGLYYYYNTFSKCMLVLGKKMFVDGDGVEHDWRADLIETLALAQNVDGSWFNEDRMWYESDASLVTGYVLTVLVYCEEKP